MEPEVDLVRSFPPRLGLVRRALELARLAQPATVGPIAFAPTGQSIATAEGAVVDVAALDGRRLRRPVDLTGRNLYVRPELTGGRISDLAYSPDGRWLAATSEREVAVWSIETGRRLVRRKLAWNRASVAFDETSERVAVAGPLELSVWGLDPLRQILRSRTDSREVRFGPGTARLTAGGWGTMHRWSVDDGRLVQSFDLPTGWSYEALSPDCTTVVLKWDRGLELGSLDSRFRTRISTDPTAACHFSPAGDFVAVGDEVGLRVFDVGTATQILDVPERRPLHAFAPDGRWLAVNADGVRLWRLRGS